MKYQKNKQGNDVVQKKGVKKIANINKQEENIEVELEPNDGECIGNYLSTDEACKICWIINDCKEATSDKRKSKKTK